MSRAIILIERSPPTAIHLRSQVKRGTKYHLGPVWPDGGKTLENVGSISWPDTSRSEPQSTFSLPLGGGIECQSAP